MLHVLPELTRAVVPDLCAALGFEELSQPVQRIMAHCAEFHHNRPGRSNGAILKAMMAGGSDRFLTLATLVKALDHLCSAAGAAEAEDAAVRDPAKLRIAIALRILDAKESKYYDVALANLGKARKVLLKEGRAGEWEALSREIREKHRRKTAFISGFERLGERPSKEPSFLERARQRWAVEPGRRRERP